MQQADGEARKKLKQTKVTLSDQLGKIVFVEVPFDLRAIDSERLRLAVRAAAVNSKTTLAIVLAHREPNPHTRYHYSIVGNFNETAARTYHPDIKERMALLGRAIENEARIDSILGMPFTRSWEAAQEHVKKITRHSPE